MQYLQAYRYVFDSEKWWLNLLCGVLCTFIPILGPIVLMGYLWEVVDSLLRDETQAYPDFDFNRLFEYFKRGLWPFLVAVAAMFVMMPVFLVCHFGLIFGGIGLMRVNEVIGVLAMVAGVAIYLVLIVLLTFVMTPLMIRAGLIQDFVPAFSFKFVRDFLRLTLWEFILVLLFIIVSGIVVGFAGMLLCCVGGYPAMVLVQFAQIHLYYQLYKLYLARGGEPIPQKATGEC